MIKYEYMLEVLENLLKNLHGDGCDALPYAENESEYKLAERADDFWIDLMNVIIKGCGDIEKEYAYAKIYAFYNAVKCYYCDAYIWEKTANSLFPRISVGCYCLVRDFIGFLEDYRNGRI